MSKKNKVRLGVVVIIVIAVVLVGASAFKTQENQFAVIKQFGKIVAVNDRAGLGFRVPFIQNVNYISKAIRLYDMNASEVITSDKKSMIIDAYILWKVVDATEYTQTLNASDTTAQSRLDAIVFNAIKTNVSAMTQDEVIASRNTKIEVIDNVAMDIKIQDIEVEDEEKQDPDELENISISDRLLKSVGTQCDQYGIEVQSIEIKVLDLPEENKSAVYERMITERNNIATAYTAQGQAEAQKIRNTTDKETAIMISEADAKAKEIVAEGEAEYMQILADAYNNPEKADFYLYTLQLDSLKEALKNSKNNTLILDEDSPFANIFNGIR